MYNSRDRYTPPKGYPSGPANISFSNAPITTYLHHSSNYQQYNRPPNSRNAPSNARPDLSMAPPQAPSRPRKYSSASRSAINNNYRMKDEHPQTTHANQYNPYPEYQGLNANRSIVMKKHLCSVGKIIRAAVHEQDFNDTPGSVAPADDSHSTMSRFGNIYSKLRWMIIVAVYEGHYLTIPLYTHNDRGLDSKSHGARLEYVSVHDGRHGENFENLSQHRKLDARMNRGTTLLKRNSVAHLTAPLTRKYGMLVEEQGHLDKRSVDYLVRIWRKCVFGEVCVLT